MGFVSLGGGIVATATEVGAAPGAVMSTAGVGAVAIGGTVTEIGVQTIARSGNSLRDDIQNFKESGNEAAKTTGGSNDVNKKRIKPWDKYTEELTKNKTDVSTWNKGSFDTVEESVARHYYEHGKEVNADSIEQYINKADNFRTNLKRTSKSYVPGEVEGVIRYKKNGRYIDLTPEGKIISFGTIK